MFDFDVVTGPANPTPAAKPAAPGVAAALTSPPPAPAAAVLRDDSREAERSAADPAGSRP
jgi:hypothetical protein